MFNAVRCFFLNYFKNYLKFSQPKIIVTGVDNDPFFYKISKIAVKTIAVVNGNRTYWNDIFINKSVNNKKIKKYFIDYLLGQDNFSINL